MQKIVTNLWFDDRVEEALELYTSVFADSRVTHMAYYGDAGPGTKGEIVTATFEIAGQEFTIINGGPGFPHSAAMSLLVNCATQAEVDELWDKLTAEGGAPGRCGWLTDRFGVNWQIVPVALGRMMDDSDAAKVQRVTEAMLAMDKLDVAALERAFNGE